MPCDLPWLFSFCDYFSNSHTKNGMPIRENKSRWTISQISAFLRLRTLFYALMTKKCYPQRYRLETYSILTV